MAKIAFVLVLGLLACAVFANAAQSYDDFLVASAKEKRSLIGAGLLSTTVVMREQILGFSATRKNASEIDINYFHMSQAQFECRLYSYINTCKHQMTDHGGNPANTDVAGPYNVDFVIVNDYIPASLQQPTDVQHYPIFVAGIVPIFKVSGVSKLVLTPATLAKMFRGCDAAMTYCLPGSITEWGDQAIKDSNPQWHAELDAAGPIKLIVRYESTGSTEILRRALAKFDDDFKLQVGVNNTRVWSASIHKTVVSPEALINLVFETPGSLSYVAANLLEDSEVGVVDIKANGFTTRADANGLAAAVEDYGLAFGNDGMPPAENTVDVTASKASRAWPISYYSYLVVRKERTDDDCLNKTKTLLDFLEHFYTPVDPDAFRGALSKGLAPIPNTYAMKVLDMIRKDIKCKGELVYAFPPPPAKIIVYTEQTSRGSMEIMARSFEQIAGAEEVQIEVMPIVSHREIARRFEETETGYIILADENLSANLLEADEVTTTFDLLSFPYAITSGAFIYNFCDPNNSTCTLNDELDGIVLDVELAAHILDGDVTMWNDERIIELNPDKPLPNMTISIYRGPTNTDFHFGFIEMIREDYIVDFAFDGSAFSRPTYAEVYRAVSVKPYTFAYVPQNGTNLARIKKAHIISRKGEAVENSIATLEACAQDTYDENGNRFALSVSQQANCYPLVDLVLLITRKNYKSASQAASKVAKMTARFLQYVVQKSIRTSADAMTVLTSSGYGTLSDFVHGETNILDTNTRLLESISLDGISVLIIPHNFRWIPDELTITMYVLLAIELFIYSGLAIWVFMHRNRKLIRNSSPTFMLQVLFGAALMSLTVIPLAQQDDFRKAQGVPLAELNPVQADLNAACVAQPVLFSLGFFTTFSALFLKSWRLIRIFNNKKLRHLFLRDKQLLIYQCGVLFIVACLNLIWALQSPLQWTRFPAFIDRELDLVVDSSGLCFSYTGIYPALPLMIGILLVLLLGNYLAYLGRRIPTEFNESKWVAMAMVVALEALALGVPVLALSNDQPVAGYLVKSSICLLISGATVALIFGPKVAMAYGLGVIEGESNPWRFVKAGSSGSNGASSKTPANAGPEPNNMPVGANSKKNGLIAPSLNSLVSGKVVVTTGDTPSATGMSRILSKRLVKEPHVGASVAQLKQVLDSDPTRRRFRRYLQTLKMDENIKFWDCVTVFRSEVSIEKRATSARAIIQTFVLDSAPFQVNLSSKVKDDIVAPFNIGDKAKLGHEEFFNKAMDELFQDLRQSDAFRMFLDNDSFSMADISRSDPLLAAGM